jgi:Coenzyme PQQ synthesis protein D (PqqD)
VSGPRFWRREDVLWRRSLDAVIFFPTGGSEPVTLAGTGPDVWALLATPASVGELARELARGYDADPRVVEADLAPVLEQLVALGVVASA